MGCGASTNAASTPPQLCVPPDKPLERWNEEDVLSWFSGLGVPVQRYRDVLLPQTGALVAMWTEEELVEVGVARLDARRLIASRDKAAEAAGEARTAAGPAAAPPAAGASGTGTLSTCGPAGQAEPGADLTAAGGGSGRDAAASGGGEQPAAGPGPGSRESLLALLTRGVKVVRKVVERLGPALPPPGGEAAALLVAVLDCVEGALANGANLQQLQSRTLAFLDILTAYQEQLVNLRRYKAVVAEYRDLLQGILCYAASYRQRSCLVRLLTVGGDAEQFQELVTSLEDLGERVMLLLAADTSARLQCVQQEVRQAAELLRSVAQYQDPSAEARRLLVELGGMQAVKADPAKLQRVVASLDVGAQVTVEAVSSLLGSHLDAGPQRHIRHAELRLFWKETYGAVAEVPWFSWWEDFPSHLVAVHVPEAVVLHLHGLLVDEASRSAFQKAVDKVQPDTLNVMELRSAFSADEDLVGQVQRLLQEVRATGSVGQSSSTSTTANKATTTATGSAATKLCQLPPMVPNYSGRDEQARQLQQHLLTRGSVVLLAPGGMGKSCLAADVGWRLVQAGQVPGGALWVDLREAGDPDEVEGRFCAALGLTRENTGNVDRVVAATRALCAAASGPNPASTLVVVDNCEDALAGSEEAAGRLREVVGQVLQHAPDVRLLLTSRTPLSALDGVRADQQPSEVHVGAIPEAAAVGLVRSTAPDLNPSEVQQVAAACHCVPLVLCLVGEALAAGRLLLEDICRSVVSTGGSRSSASSAGDTSSTVQVVLSSLRKQQLTALVQLAVFPSGFVLDGAAAVLGGTEAQAQALLAELRRYSLVQRAGPQQHSLHPLVRQLAMEQGQRLDPHLQQRAEARFVDYMTAQVKEWGKMYGSAQEWKLAFLAAREHQPDLGRLLELLAQAGATATAGGQVNLEQALGRLHDSYGLLLALNLPRRMQPMLCSTLQFAQQQGAAGAVLAVYTGLILSYIHTWNGQNEEAEQHARAASQAAPQLLGEEHPATIASISSLATCYQNQRRFGEAENLTRQTLELRQKVLGEKHPSTIGSITGLAHCVNAQGRHGDAEQLYRQALELRRMVLGEDNPHTMASTINLATCYHAQGRDGEAEPLYRLTVEAWRKVLGEEHPDTAYAIECLATCVNAQGRYGEAEPLYRQALELWCKALGEEDPDNTIGKCRSDLAACIKAQGRDEEAAALLSQVKE